MRRDNVSFVSSFIHSQIRSTFSSHLKIWSVSVRRLSREGPKRALEKVSTNSLGKYSLDMDPIIIQSTWRCAVNQGRFYRSKSKTNTTSSLNWLLNLHFLLLFTAVNVPMVVLYPKTTCTTPQVTFPRHELLRELRTCVAPKLRLLIVWFITKHAPSWKKHNRFPISERLRKSRHWKLCNCCYTGQLRNRMRRVKNIEQNRLVGQLYLVCLCRQVVHIDNRCLYRKDGVYAAVNHGVSAIILRCYIIFFRSSRPCN